MSQQFKMIVIQIAAISLCAACSTTPHSNSSEVYHDSAYNDLNRAPSSMSPPNQIDQKQNPLDPVFMRTQADYNFAMGEAFSFEGNHSKAVESFKLVLVYDPNSAQVPLRLAAEYVKMGMLTEAVEQAEVGVAHDSKSVNGHLLLGGLYSTLKAYDKALAQYNEVLKNDSKNTEAPMYIGAVYAEQKKYDQAIKYFEALTKNEDYSTPYLAYYYIGRVRSEQSGVAYEKAAEKAFKKALELKPDYVDSLLALTGLYEKHKQDEKVLKTLKDFQRERGPVVKVAEVLAQKYLEAEDYDAAFEQLEVLEANVEDSLSVKVKMALVLIEQKKYDQAVLKLHDILRYVPESDKIRFYLAAVYEEMNKPSDAVKHYSQIPSASQFYGESILHAAYLLKQQKQLGDAISLVKSAMKERDDIPQLYALYASLLDEKGDLALALSTLETGAKKFPEHVQIQFFLGTVQDRLGARNKTIDAMKKVIEMDPNHVQGLNYLAFTYAEQGEHLDQAEKLVRRALEFEPNDGFILDTLGWILLKTGKLKESIKTLETAYQRAPTESIIAEHLGDAYYKFELVEKAKVMYEKAVENESDAEKAKTIRAKITSIQHQDILKSERKPASVDGN